VSVVYDVLRSRSVQLLQIPNDLREHLLAARAGKISNVW
jgi:hypothetical protein